MSEHHTRLVVKVELTPEHTEFDSTDPETPQYEYLKVSRVKTSNGELVLHGLQPTESELLGAELVWLSGSMDDFRAKQDRPYQKFPLVHVPTDKYRVTIPSNFKGMRDQDENDTEREAVEQAAREYREGENDE